VGAAVLLDAKENALDVQVHHFVERALGSLVKRRAPRGTRVGEQDVDMFGMLADLSDKAFDFRRFGDVGWYGDGFARKWKRVKGGASFLACCGFARCDEDLRAAGLDETGPCELWIAEVHSRRMNIPRCSMKAQASRATSNYCYLAI